MQWKWDDPLCKIVQSGNPQNRPLNSIKPLFTLKSNKNRGMQCCTKVHIGLESFLESHLNFLFTCHCMNYFENFHSFTKVNVFTKKKSWNNTRIKIKIRFQTKLSSIALGGNMKSLWSRYEFLFSFRFFMPFIFYGLCNVCVTFLIKQ